MKKKVFPAAIVQLILFMPFFYLLTGCGSGNQTSTSKDTDISIQYDKVTSKENVTISGTVEEGAKVFVATNNGAPEGEALVEGTSWSFLVTGLVEGDNHFKITAKRANRNLATIEASIRRDTLSPDITLNTVPSISHLKSLTFSGTVESGASVQIKTDTNTTVGEATVTGNKWEYTLYGLINGVNHITITAQDPAGNTTQIVTQTTLKLAEVIAHKGSSSTAPENTLAAFTLAWQQGADSVELDIRLSKDNRIMVIHDETTGAVAGKNLVVKDTNSDVLRTLDVGSIKGSKYAGERIPFLEEAIATIPAGKRIFVEIKTGSEILPFLQKTIVNSGKQDQIIVCATDSSGLRILAGLRKLMPTITLYYSVSSIQNEQRLLQDAVDNKMNGLGVDYRYVTSSLISAANNAGLKVFAWTVDDWKIAERIIGCGLDGIFTNMPDVMLSNLNS